MGNIKYLVENRYRAVVFLFFAAYLLLGLVIFRDYGVSHDEMFQRIQGIVALKYAVNGDQFLLEFRDRYYGPAFEIVLVILEKVFNLTKNPRSIYMMRHLATFLLFYFSVFLFYLLVKRKFDSWKMGLLGCLFFILSPRIFAHSFYNSKDIGCLALFIISVYTMIKYLDNKTIGWALLHALASAFLIDIRIMGSIIPLLTALFCINDIIFQGDKTKKKAQATGILLVYVSFLVFFIILFWPTLWPNPVGNFLKAAHEAIDFEWEDKVLYLGNYVSALRLPWHYLFVWIIISTPVIYSVFFFIGAGALIKQFLPAPARFFTERRNDLIFILWLILPLAAVVIFRPALHDGWRHMLFVYPPFLIISLAGLNSLFSRLKTAFLKSAVVIFIAVSLCLTAAFMIRRHPLQNVYFNSMAGRNMQQIKERFELDYWGLSYRKALEYILKTDKRKVIKINTDFPCVIASYILSNNERDRIVFVSTPEEAEYFVSNYRWHKEEYPYKNEYYSVKIDGAKIAVVYKLEG